MRQLKCREWDFGVPGIRNPQWHYWGYIDGVWEGTIYGKLHESQGLFTGLLDKNGKEIYEGDILDNKRVKFIARWDISGYYYAEVIGDKGYVPEHDKLCHYGNNWEVIGNIYENPELIKKGGE